MASAAVLVAVLGLVVSECGGGGSSPPSASNSASKDTARPDRLAHSAAADRDYHITGLKGFWAWQSGDVHFDYNQFGVWARVPIGCNKNFAERWLTGVVGVQLYGGNLTKPQKWEKTVLYTSGDETIESRFAPQHTVPGTQGRKDQEVEGIRRGQTYHFKIYLEYKFDTYESSEGTFTVPN